MIKRLIIYIFIFLNWSQYPRAVIIASDIFAWVEVGGVDFYTGKFPLANNTMATCLSLSAHM